MFVNFHSNTLILSCLSDLFTEANGIGVVMDYFDGGDLRSYLLITEPKPTKHILDKTTLCQFMQFGLDIASGMNHLEKKRVSKLIITRTSIL